MLNLRTQKSSHTGLDNSKTNQLLLGLLILLVLMIFMPTVHSQGNTFVVNSIDDVDDGICDVQHCSLREALNASNTNAGADTITFAIPGAGPYIIQLADELPTITDPIVIDGTTQAGYTGKPLIELDGVNTFAANGLVLNAGSSTVRGLVIGRFQFDAISIGTAGGNTIAGNYLGTDVTGLQARPNRYGIYVYNSSNNQIGGVTLADRNVISANNSGGVYIVGTANSGGSNTIQGNFIGVGSDGVTALANKAQGLIISSPSNTIGGTTSTIPTGPCSGACNVISSNLSSGILLEANVPNTVIQGNYIGADVSGSLLRRNQRDGIEFNSGGNNIQIGGVTPSARNVISGNSRGEIFVRGTAHSGITIQGNYLGLNASGSRALGNGEYGIFLAGGETIVGGTQPGAGNVVSGHLYYGIALDYGRCDGGGSCSYATILGNYVGTDATGTVAVPNQQGIVNIANSYPAVVGGIESGARNVVSGNLQNGIITSYGMSVLGNYIGVDASGYQPLGNGKFGIEVQGHQAQIGRPIAGAGNVIAYNGDDGISVRYENDYNSIAGNSIYSNGGIGIDLHLISSINDEGPTLNDPGDSDNGANRGQNYPTISTVSFINNQMTITGTLNSDTNKTYRIEFFANSTCDSSGFGEGERYLGYQTTATDGSGNANFSVTLANKAFVGDYITATATYYANGIESNNRTSEFSPCRRLLPPANFTAPSGLTSQLVSQTYAVLSWQDNTSDETAFYLERSPNGLTNWTEIGTIHANATKYWVTDLACNSTNYYRVRALRGDGQFSNASNILTVTTQPCSQPTPRAFLVNSTTDSSDGICTIQNCTLREAITAANANTGSNIIVFNLAGNAPYTIQPLLPLPLITSPMTIDGTSQPGYAASPLIVVNGDLIPPAQAGTEPTRVGINITGGGTTVSGFVINGWDYAGVGIMNGGGNVIKGNYIGTDASGNTAVPNLYGVIIYESSNNVIGGATVAAHNVISGNMDDGVKITGTSDQNLVSGNSIFGNGHLGIDLGGDGVTSNDAGDVDTGANGLQNFPMLTVAYTWQGEVVVRGNLQGTAGAIYQLEFYMNDTCNASGNGEGQTYISSQSLTVDGNGDGAFTMRVNFNVPANKFITATATNPSNNTSEFSACIQAIVPSLPPNHYQETDDAFIYSGNWYSYIGSGPEGGSSKYSNDPSAKVSIPLADSVESITIFHTRNTIYGAMDMYLISGGITTKLATIPGNGPLAWAVPFNISVPAGSNRVIELRNTSSSYIGVEAVDLLGALPYLLTGSYEESNSNFIYSGNWVGFTGAGPQGGAFKYSNDPNAKMIFGVDNTVGRITFYRTTHNIYGSTQIYLDGASTPFATMNNTSAGLLFGVPFTVTIPSGNHTVELRNVGTNYSSVDRIDLLAPSVALPAGTYQETDANLTYLGIWTPNASASALGGSRRYTKDPNARVTFNINNTVGRVMIYRTVASTGWGSMQVYVDGVLNSTMANNTSSTVQYGVPFAVIVTPGNHTIELRNVGSSFSDIDQIDLLASTAALGTGTYQENDAQLTYSGIWTTASSLCSGCGTRRYANTPNARVNFTINNTVGRVTIFRTVASNAWGSMQVYVDGVLNSTIPNNISSTVQYGVPFTFTVTPGTHAIELRNVGSTFSDIDQITLDAPPISLPVGTYQENNPNLTYIGNWVTTSSALGGERRYTNDPNGRVSFNIDGSVGRLTIYRTVASSAWGSMQVYVDGVLNGVIANNTSSTVQFGVPYTFTVTPGVHSIELRNLGSTFSDIDQIMLEAPTAALGVGTYQETQPEVTYTGSWVTTTSTMGGARRYTNDPNARLSFNINSSVGRVTIFRTVAVSSWGSMQVYVDNVLTGTIANNTSSTVVFGVPYSFTVTPGNHRIELRNVNAAFSDIDQITLAGPAVPLAIGTYEETHDQLTYSGIWTPITHTGALGGARLYTNDPNGRIFFNIDNSIGYVTIFRTVAGNTFGTMQIYVDGVLNGTMTNNTSATVQYGVAYTLAVTPGNHIIELRNIGSKFSDIDRIVVQAPGSLNLPIITPTIRPTIEPNATLEVPAVQSTATFETPTVTATVIPTEPATVEPTQTMEPTVTELPTQTPVPTEIPSNTPLPTELPTQTPVPTSTPLPTDVPTGTPMPMELPTAELGS